MMAHPHVSLRMSAPDDAADPAKKPRLSQEERLQRSRERNRMHARRTRERKKLQMAELQERLDVLRDKGIRLREKIEHHAMAGVLLSIRATDERAKGLDGFEITATKSFPFPYNGREELCSSIARFIMTGEEVQDKPEQQQRPPRKKEKLSREEREQIRRERNRVHAKRTRDRKKLLLEESEMSSSA